jgi:hypothetical protein
LGHIPRISQQSTHICKGMPSWYCLQIHLSMPLGTCGILLIGTWVLTQPIKISIIPTNRMNNIKIVLLKINAHMANFLVNQYNSIRNFKGW